MSISPVCGYGAVGFIEYPGATCLHTGGSFGVIGSSGQAGAAGSFGTVVYSGMTGTAACSGTTDTIGTAGTVGTATYSGTTGTTGTAGTTVYPGTTSAAVTKGRSGTWRPPAVTCPEVAVPMVSAATVCHVTVAIAPC
ncbi:hypothetical protein ACWDTT_27910 [Streptosporangium sandarakinum]|uniref:hypothetical protein n=1 Tax=Streptosporangium sandarakinum TaxID=1260955 RepID=UPI003D904EBF